MKKLLFISLLLLATQGFTKEINGMCFDKKVKLSKKVDTILINKNLTKEAYTQIHKENYYIESNILYFVNCDSSWDYKIIYGGVK